MEKPRFYLQPGAVDSAILFWLNYKNTYEFWIEQRQQFSDLLLNETFSLNLGRGGERILKSTSDGNKRNSTGGGGSVNASDKQFLLIKLRVTGLGVALPLTNTMSKDFSGTNIDCLVITLNETAIYACSSGCVVSKGQFSNFCLRFSENFNLSSSEWAPATLTTATSVATTTGAANQGGGQHQQENFYSSKSGGKCLMNAWVVPSGNYEVCSSTIEKPTVLSEF